MWQKGQIMTITTRLYSAKVLDTEIDGKPLKGSSIYISGDNREPQKIFINQNIDVAKTLIDYLNGFDDETNPLVECDVTLNGKKVKYNDIRPFKNKK